MATLRWVVAALPACLTAFAPSLAGQQGKPDSTATILALVADTAHQPIELAEVFLLRSQRRATTGTDGLAVIIKVPVGDEVVQIRRIGYAVQRRTLRIAPGDTVRLGVILDAQAQTLPTIGVEARGRVYKGKLQLFGERMRYAVVPPSSFVTPDDIEKLEPGLKVSDVLRRRGFRTIINRGHLVPICPRVYVGRDPVVKVYLDGVLLNTKVYPSGTGSISTAEDFPLEISMDMVAAMEIYRSASELPIELTGRNGDCAVVIWTR